MRLILHLRHVALLIQYGEILVFLVQNHRVKSISWFFQAEDGIRDTSVTGVQTCALPIYPLGDARRGRRIVVPGTPRQLRGAGKL